MCAEESKPREPVEVEEITVPANDSANVHSRMEKPAFESIASNMIPSVVAPAELREPPGL
ncbi:hypothetical protein CLV45_2270 [Hymenobacter chitinivorans DSM 11115]|uniref:Uncharacterized protein n=2 Tax=Hymenobacter chitinivorans TaxID=89969 RepID=A0A2M9BSC9_9BACT|nr:hypothetical protein CLV45_2270 [Hymenobacter chitinivorans DSM 11115]